LDFLTQNQVALQLCCCLIISSFRANQTFKNRSITLKASGIYIFSLLVSHIKTAQYFQGFKILKLSFATFSISSQNLSIL